MDPEERRAASRSLQGDIRTHGFGFIPIEGSWTENAPEEAKLKDRFYLVIGNAKDSGNLKGFLRKQGIQYRQEAFILKPYGTEEAELHERSGRFTKIGRWHPGRVSEYYSMLRGKGRTFAFERVRFLKPDTFFSAYWSIFRGRCNIEYDF